MEFASPEASRSEQCGAPQKQPNVGSCTELGSVAVELFPSDENPGEFSSHSEQHGILKISDEVKNSLRMDYPDSNAIELACYDSTNTIVVRNSTESGMRPVYDRHGNPVFLVLKDGITYSHSFKKEDKWTISVGRRLLLFAVELNGVEFVAPGDVLDMLCAHGINGDSPTVAEETSTEAVSKKAKELGHHDDQANYGRVPLPILPDTNTLDRASFIGPNDESNWVLFPTLTDDGQTTGGLIAGACPLDVDTDLCAIKHTGTNGVVFANLMSEYPSSPKINIEYHKSLCESEYVHLPIVDGRVAKDSAVVEFATSLVNSIASGKVVYLHCWGGHGRTGTLVCIVLILMYGLTSKEAMDYCQTVHDFRKIPLPVRSPDTLEQRNQVCRIATMIEQSLEAKKVAHV